MAHSASMPRSSHLEGAATAQTWLEPSRGAPALARRFTRDVLLRQGADGESLERAMLLVSELVTNAVLHAGTAVRLSVSAAGGAARIEVEDRGAGNVSRRTPGDLRGWTAGYGLWLVDSLAEAWGVEPGAGGGQAGPGGKTKRVWLRLALWA